MEKQYSIFNGSSSRQDLRRKIGMERAVTLKTEELELLIKATQAGDRVASRRLYDGFLLLLYEITSESILFNKLGEDAFSMACEEFYKLVNSYRGPDFQHFPGLVRKVVRSRLFRALNKKEHQQEQTESYEQRLETGFDIPYSKDEIAQLLNQKECQQALQSLSPEAKLLLYRYFYLDIPLKQQAETAGVTLRTLERRYKKSLELLREARSKNPSEPLSPPPYS